MCLRRHLAVLGLLMVAVVACKTPSRAPRSDLEAADKDIIRLKEFTHEVDATLLRSLAGRVGCQLAAQMVLHPTGASLKKNIEAVYRSESPYDTISAGLFDSTATEKLCKSSQVSRQTDPAFAMGRLISKLKSKNLGLTFVMVGGFGSHLTDEGALYESRRLWQSRFASESKFFRVIRHECEPNSFASDDVCSPLLVKRFKELEASRGDTEHRYLFWGYSKGGTSLLQALSQSPELREKTLALITVGSPIGGGLPISVAKPLLEQVAQKKSALSTTDRATLNALVAFGAGSPLDSQSVNMASRLSSLLEDQEFRTLQNGFESLDLERRKKFIYEKMKTWDFTRKNQDPITASRQIPIFHVAATTDVARLDPIPNLTVNQNGDIVTDARSQNLMHLAEMVMLTKFRSHPLSDTCVAMEHAVIPANATPAGASVKLLALLKMDHMSLGLSKALRHGKNQIPHLEIVDSLLEAMMVSMGLGVL